MRNVRNGCYWICDKAAQAGTSMSCVNWLEEARCAAPSVMTYHSIDVGMMMITAPKWMNDGDDAGIWKRYGCAASG